MTDTSGALSRRTLLAGLAAAPALTSAPAPVAAQTPAAKTAAERAQAALKDATAKRVRIVAGMLPPASRPVTLQSTRSCACARASRSNAARRGPGRRAVAQIAGSGRRFGGLIG